MPRKREAVDIEELENRDHRDEGRLAEDDAIFSGGPTVQSRSLRVMPNGVLSVGALHFTEVGLEVHGKVVLQDWLASGRALHRVEQSIQWLLGDWANLGLQYVEEWVTDEEYAAVPEETKPPSKYEFLLSLTDYGYQTLRDYAWVARQMPLSIRNRHVPFAHHRLIAGVKDDDGDRDIPLWIQWLERAETGDGRGKTWTVAELRAALYPTPLPSADSVRASIVSETEVVKRIMQGIGVMGRGDRKTVKETLQYIHLHKKWLSDAERVLRDILKDKG